MDHSEPAREHLEAALAAQEGLRSTLGDAIVDATIAALRAELDRRAPGGAVDRRRRLTTVLFVDVVDSTGLLRDRDPEETMAVMDSALQRLAEPIRDHGGRVTRFMGDGYLAVFGLSTSRENDPELAVRAGLAVQQRAGVLASELADSHGLDGFGVRVGINTGAIVAGGTTEAEDTIMGSEVNLAARIEAAAPPGGVLVSLGTLRHVRDRFEVEPRGEITAKGFAEPIPVFLVVGVAERRGARPVIEGVTTPMVGRDAELAALQAAVAAAVDSGSLQMVEVCGATGIGKSRLVREFESGLGPSVACARTRVAPDDHDVPNALIRDLLARAFGIRAGDPIDAVAARLTDGLAGLGGDVAVKAALIGRLAGWDPHPGAGPDDPERARALGLRHLADHLRPASEPAVLVAEDLQWADPASVDALDVLVDHLRRTPTVVVMTARPDFWSDRSRADALVVDLPPLGREDLGRAADAILEHVDGGADLRALLVDGAEGNPYFLEELVRMLVDDGVVVDDGDRWSVVANRLTDLRVPPTLVGTIQARLDGLSAGERRVLQQASVIGRVFWRDAVQRLARPGDANDVRSRLDDLAARSMVRPRPDSAFPDTVEFAFEQSLLRDVTYETVLLEDRRAHHSAAADWLAEHGAGRRGEFAGTIAHHLERAGRDADALEYLELAARAARDAYAVDAAAGFLRRAIALVPDEDLARRLALTRDLALQLRRQGRRDEEHEALLRLDELADRLGDEGSRADVLLVRAWSAFWSSELDRMAELAHAAIDLAVLAGDDGLEARTRVAAAWAHLLLGQSGEARAQGEAALARAETAGEADTEGTALNIVALAAQSERRYSEACQLFERLRDRAVDHGDRTGETTALVNLGVSLVLLGRYEAAVDILDRAVATTTEVGDRLATSTALVNRAWARAGAADWGPARHDADRGLALTRSLGHTEATAEALVWLGHIRVGLGDPDGAESAYAEALRLRRDLGQAALATGAHAGLARVALHRGEVERARTHVAPILDYLPEDPRIVGTWEPVRIYLTCVEVLEASGDERTEEVLTSAHELLISLAGGIDDPADRRVFLEDVPWHRAVVERWEGR
ncbi:MAG: adenylate/guanylate cyclase domain-containing protein [Acidimicrobiia bacterium]|nr:adenylate/guanylate cyclase domain-containing protein [Acidimicrobiia bacterium]